MNSISKICLMASLTLCSHIICAQSDTSRHAGSAPVVPGQREGSGPENNYNHPPANKERSNNTGTNNPNYNSQTYPDSVRNAKKDKNNRNSPGATPGKNQ